MTPLQQLQYALSRLPGIGRRSAERIALRLIQDPERRALRELQDALALVDREVRLCSRCGYVTSANVDPCELCTNPNRNDKLLCLVEDIADITTLEQARTFAGRYYCLQGKLSPMAGRSIAPKRLEDLMLRIKREGVTEILLALNADVESDATAAFLAERLRAAGLENAVRITRLALGIPAGGGVSYADPLTLARAIEGRQDVRFGDDG